MSHENLRRDYPKYITREVTFTRPADTTAYAAGDAISDSTSAPTAFEIPNCVEQNGAGGLLLSTLIMSTNPSTTNASFDLLVFESTYTPVNDNAAFTISSAQRDAVVESGQHASSIFVADAAGKSCVRNGRNLPFVCGPESKSLYIALLARGAYVPTSGERLTIRLGILLT